MAIVNVKKLSNFISEKATEISIFSLIYGLVWIIAKEEALPPNGTYFVLLAIFGGSYIGGELCDHVNLPPLLGMLIGGCILRNISNISTNAIVSSLLRYIALATILLRAGLGLDFEELRKSSTVCIRLAFAPCIVETITTAVTAYIFYDFPVVWGLLLGFVLCAVSPAIVVKHMLLLKEQNLGTDKGIPTLVIAAASFDDILAITGFGVVAGVAFSENTSLVWDLFKAPLEALGGICLGAIIGLLLSILPSSYDADNETLVKEERQRVVLTITFGTFLVLYTRDLDLGGVGALAALTLTLVSAMSWRRHRYHIAVDETLKVVWNLVEPFLFGLIGAEMEISILRVKTVILSLITLTIGLVTRCFSVIAVLQGANFNMKERIFIALAWLPKATVQAALGPVALDKARENKQEEYMGYGTLVLTLAVISIFITAPLGALAISIAAPRLLTKSSTSTTADKHVE